MTEKRKRGRPAIEHPKGVMISARFTESEAAEIELAAKKSGVPRSEWIQKTLLSEAGRLNRNT